MSQKPPAKRRKVGETVRQPAGDVSASVIADSLAREAKRATVVETPKALHQLILATPAPKRDVATQKKSSLTTTGISNKIEQRIASTPATPNRHVAALALTSATTTTTTTTNNGGVVIRSDNGSATRLLEMSDQLAVQVLAKPNVFPYLVAGGTGIAGHGIDDIGRLTDDLVFESYMRATGKHTSTTLTSATDNTYDVLVARNNSRQLDTSHGAVTTFLPPSGNDVDDDNDDDKMNVDSRGGGGGDSIQSRLQEEFARDFLFDTAEATPLGVPSDVSLTTLQHRYIANVGEQQQQCPKSDATKIQADPLVASYILKRLKAERDGFFSRMTNEGHLSVDQLPSCPVIPKAQLHAWLISSESDRERPTCMYGSECLCVKMASRSGSIDQDRRIEQKVFNGAVPLTSRKATAIPNAEAAGLVRDRVTFTNAPTQSFIGLRFMTPDELQRWQADKTAAVEPGPCLVCHLYEVSFTHQTLASGNYLADKQKLPRNRFCVAVDRPGEFRSDVCLPMLPTNHELTAQIQGFFPRFDPQDFDYDSVVIDGMHSKTAILRWIGMDFRPTSAE